jgi:hypothetical protein
MDSINSGGVVKKSKWKKFNGLVPLAEKTFLTSHHKKINMYFRLVSATKI